MHAHGGPPLRLGVPGDAGGRAVARLVLAHLRDGVGYAVEWVPFPDESSLRSSLLAGKVDVAVLSPEGGSAPDTRFYAVTFSGAEGPPGLPGVAVSSRALAELRFTILGSEIGKLMASLGLADIDGVRAAEEQGGERAGAAAARAAVAGKGLR